jgi:hypothetical protein
MPPNENVEGIEKRVEELDCQGPDQWLGVMLFGLAVALLYLFVVLGNLRDVLIAIGLAVLGWLGMACVIAAMRHRRSGWLAGLLLGSVLLLFGVAGIVGMILERWTSATW